MSIKVKRLVNPYEERMLEFLETCINNNYKIHTQVSLCQFCELNGYLDSDLKRFFFSSNVDALITTNSYKPCLVVEFQSSYHDSAEVKERDHKKATLLSLAGIPFLYSRIQDFGLLRLFSSHEEVVFNLFTDEQRDNAKNLVKKYCELSAFAQLQLTH
ncbi:hypothetical protein NIES2111_28950 [Nostoc sp. NIES-2111]|nr:hypothetical protein NIES2111_28950 [Nostoc sp. NIES-2111]